MVTSAIEEAVLQNLKGLPLSQKQTVLDFVQFLRQKGVQKLPRRNPIGLFADLKVKVTANDISEARQEMWGNFPRDIEL